MRNFLFGIATVFAFALIGCEDTNTTTETASDTQEVKFTGANDNATTTTVTTGGTTTDPASTGTTEPTEVDENNETNTVPDETEPTTPEQETDPTETERIEEESTETERVEDEVTLDDLTVEEFADIELLRESIFGGLGVGKDLYLNQVSLVLEDLGLDSGYQVSDDSQELPETSTCPYVEFYNNQAVMNGYACEYLVDTARSEAYSKLYSTLKANRENYNPDVSEQDFWFEQGAVSGLEEARVMVRVDLKSKQLCNKNPSPVKSSAEKGLIVGRQHFINTMNNWLTTNGYTGDYPVMSDPIEVCQADQSVLDPVFNDSIDTISQAMEQNPLCDDYAPVDSDDEIMFAQAQTDYSKALEEGIQDEFAMAAVKIFKVVPCNVSDPIVIDLNNNGRFDITAIQNGVNFSMFGKRKTVTSWLNGDGFLFYDRNKNGIADDGTEFFGTSNEFSGGFSHLSTIDTNKDGRVDFNDKGFHSLFVWSDFNYDGICTSEEVTPIMETKIASIPLNADQYQKVSTRVNGSRVKSTVRVPTGDNRVLLFGDVDLRSGMYPKLQK